MRLEKIKISGFKSFVDPTIIPLPANITGIVGPNGCGKSNIIDAVRWVMGESSARHLRGGSLVDVIFNGSTARKPVGMASVELVFDNSDGRAAPEYAKFNQISIKRQVTREGESSYLFNGARCRRKDITDIFLGTGLGPRSYAIIEQGTISRLIEAKPEELRVFIEEAAGISKYKERRRETETRMRHTRDNLVRLQDVRDEIAKQLSHLKTQADKAERYKRLKHAQRRCKQELVALRWRAQERVHQAQHLRIVEMERDLEQRLAEQRAMETSSAALESDQKALQRALNETQAAFYAVSAEIARHEQELRHAKLSAAEIAKELERLRGEQARGEAEMQQDAQHLAEIRRERVTVQADLGEAEALAAEAVMQHDEAREALRLWQGHWDDHRERNARSRQKGEVHKARVQQLKEQKVHFDQREKRLREERETLFDPAIEREILALEVKIADLEAVRERNLQRLQENTALIEAERVRMRACEGQVNTVRAQLQQLAGSIAALELLQQHALGKDRAAGMAWLAKHGLSDARRLLEYLEVRSGWETALERVLGVYLEAVCVQDAEVLLARLDQNPETSIAFFETHGRRVESRPSNASERLADQVRSPWNLDALLAGIYCAADGSAALAMRDTLAAHESVVTPEGFWLGPGWMLLGPVSRAKRGALQRENELRALRARRERLEGEHAALEQRLDDAGTKLSGAEAERDAAQKLHHDSGAELAQIHALLSRTAGRREHHRERAAKIEQELGELGELQRRGFAALAEAEDLVAEAEGELHTLDAAGAALTDARQGLLAAVQEADAAVERMREQVGALKTRLETLKSSEILTSKHVQRIAGQNQESLQHIQDLEKKLMEVQAPIAGRTESLDGLLQRRSGLERELARARQALDERESALGRAREQILQAEREIDKDREQLEQVRLEHQSCEVRRQTLAEQLRELDVQAERVLENLPEQAEEGEWQRRVEEFGGKIERLGAVNLTAVEEYTALGERMRYLDQQHQDLIESLETLEQAIRKIDRENRARFRDTFERVNSGLKTRFPKLFGGGEAYLELDDDDLLTTGVRVMARPPGKRNNTIHALSGGEKALTAVALVFSFFDLNPAPFCLLDEVDAPLDETNVGRFCQLVEEMSQTVQMVFITHNKVTMESARHLAGVTMREPGVSRMVAVDIDEAVELAAV